MPTYEEMRPRQPTFEEMRAGAPTWDQTMSALPNFDQMTSAMPGIGEMKNIFNSGSRLNDGNGQRPVSQLPFAGGHSMQEDRNSVFYNTRPSLNFAFGQAGQAGHAGQAGSMMNSDMSQNMDQLSGNMRSLMNNGFDIMSSRFHNGAQQPGAGPIRQHGGQNSGYYNTRPVLNNGPGQPGPGPDMGNNMDNEDDRVRSGSQQPGTGLNSQYGGQNSGYYNTRPVLNNGPRQPGPGPDVGSNMNQASGNMDNDDDRTRSGLHVGAQQPGTGINSQYEGQNSGYYNTRPIGPGQQVPGPDMGNNMDKPSGNMNQQQGPSPNFEGERE